MSYSIYGLTLIIFLLLVAVFYLAIKTADTKWYLYHSRMTEQEANSEAYRWQVRAINAEAEKNKPVDMLIVCPKCYTLHVDAPETDDVYELRCELESVVGKAMPERWTNPAHRSHKCGHCSYVWRFCDVATNGVAEIETAGKNDTINF